MKTALTSGRLKGTGKRKAEGLKIMKGDRDKVDFKRRRESKESK